MTRWLFRHGGALGGALLALACATTSPATVSIPEPPRPRAAPPPAAVPSEPKSERATEPVDGDDEGDTRMSSWVGSSRGWLGVELEATDPDEAGVRVLRVVPKSPAEGLAEDEVLLPGERDIGAAVLPVQNFVTDLHVHREPGAFLGYLAGSDGDDLALRGLLLCGVRDVESAAHLLGLIEGLHHDAVGQRLHIDLDLGLSHSCSSTTWGVD
jgi:hypothetical protein